MIEKEKGNVYEVQTAQGAYAFTVTFCKKEGDKFIDGITSEELLQVLIERHRDLISKHNSDENLNTFTHLTQAKMWMSLRNTKKLNSKKRQ